MIMSPNEVESRYQRELVQMEENRNWLLTLAEKLGYKVTIIEKNHNEEEDDAKRETYSSPNRQWTRDFQRSTARQDTEIYLLEATRQDGETVTAQIVLIPTEGSFAFPVDIESPAFYKGHSGNHDMSRSELEGSLISALEGQKYPK